MFKTGIKVQGEITSMLRFTNDIVLAESKVELNKMVNGTEKWLKEEFGQKSIKIKTKVLKSSRNVCREFLKH